MDDTERLNKIVDSLIKVLIENECTIEEANRMLRSAGNIISESSTVQPRKEK